MTTRVRRPEVVAAKLRPGAGAHADRRTRRERDRSAVNRKSVERSQRGE